MLSVKRVRNPLSVNGVVISRESEDQCESKKNECGPDLVETLQMLDKICQCPTLDEKIIAILGDVTQTLVKSRN